MKYNTVHIRPVFNPKNKPIKNGWEYYFTFDDQDRVKGKTQPHALGFYIHPSHMQNKRAFDKLKKFMIARHKKEIKLLQRSLRDLEKLELKG